MTSEQAPQDLQDQRRWSPDSLLLAGALLGLSAGACFQLNHQPKFALSVWTMTIWVVMVPALWTAAKRIFRREFTVDFIAVTALAGALMFDEVLAGAIIAVMMTGGAALEKMAFRRATRELTALLKRAPRVAHRRQGQDLVTISVNDVKVGDWLVVKPGEVVPADGLLASSIAILDESALTGEARPVELACGACVRSGGANVGAPIELRVTTSPDASTYAGILRLVEQAEGTKSPFVRLADKFARYFLIVTVVMVGVASQWGHDPTRALAVLVSATPCPLLLAAPAAIMAGVSLAARHGVVFKGGAPLESLATITVMLLDKTGTVTSGQARVLAIESFGKLSVRELLHMAASLEQLSGHPFAPAVLAEARLRGIELAFPEEVEEQLGTGIVGVVSGRRVAVGLRSWVASQEQCPEGLRAMLRRATLEGLSSVFISIDGCLEGGVLLQDPIRPEAVRSLSALRNTGIRTIHLVSGDHPDVAELVGDALGFDRVYAERAPDDKVELVRMLRRDARIGMVGDGLNDAPALAIADVGVAMGARGATAAAEAADVVIAVDRLSALAVARRIAIRTRSIAYQSVIAGMGLSITAMGFAALGYLTPVSGAVVQEFIDVAVLLNALRALSDHRMRRRPEPVQSAMLKKIAAMHNGLRGNIEEMASLAGKLPSLEPHEALRQLEAVGLMLERNILPHERSEQKEAFPLLQRLLSPEDPTGPLVSTHYEILRLSRLFSRLLSQLPPGGPAPDDWRDLQRALYGLHAILTLHQSQEDECFSVLD